METGILGGRVVLAMLNLRPADAEQRCGPAEKLSAGLAVLKIAVAEGREKKGDVQRVRTDLQ